MLDEQQTHSSLINNQTFNMTRSAQLVVLFVLLATLAYSCEARVCYGGPNDVWTNCGSHCPRTCADPNPGPCILSCKPDSCECREDFYRRADGQCVLFHECGRRY